MKKYIIGLLLSFMSVVWSQTDSVVAQADIVTRDLSLKDGKLSAEIKVGFSGQALTNANYNAQIVDESNAVLTNLPFYVDLAKANHDLAKHQYYQTDWLTLSTTDVALKSDKLFIRIIEQSKNVISQRSRTASGQQNESKISLARQMVTHADFAYTAKDVTVTNTHVDGKVAFTISGQTVSTTNNDIVPYVNVAIVIAHHQFEIPITVSSDSTGKFSYTFITQGNMSGDHRVSVVHPDDNRRPEQGKFTIASSAKVTSRAAKFADLSFKQSLLKTGVRFEQRVTEKVTIENTGTMPAENAKVSISSLNNETWARIVSQRINASLEKEWEVHVEFAPPKTFKTEGVYDFSLNLEYGVEPNIVKKSLPIKVTVTNNQLGDYTFKVEDIYTDFTGKGGNKGLADARITLTKDNVKTSIVTGKTTANGEFTFKNLSSGFYNYQVSADKHNSDFGEVYVRAGINSRQKIFLDIPVVKVDWSVTETTIEDKYDIIVDATYETDVPAPVIVIKPEVVELPAMKAGDVFKGTLTITNDGLISAREFTASLPTSDKYATFTFNEEALPEKLLPMQTIYLPYTIRANRSFELDPADFRAKNLLTSLTTSATSRATCSRTFGYYKSGSVKCKYTCSNGDNRGASGSTTFVHTGTTKTYSCGNPSTSKRKWAWWSCDNDNKCCGSCQRGTGSGGYGRIDAEPAPAGMSPCRPSCRGSCCSANGGPGPSGGPGGGGPNGPNGAPPMSDAFDPDFLHY